MYRAYRDKGLPFPPEQLITVSVVPHGLFGSPSRQSNKERKLSGTATSDVGDYRNQPFVCSNSEMGPYLPQEGRIEGATFSSRCRPPMSAAPQAAAAPAASAAAKVNAIITALRRSFAAASRDSERICPTRRSASAGGRPVRADTSWTRWS